MDQVYARPQIDKHETCSHQEIQCTSCSLPSPV